MSTIIDIKVPTLPESVPDATLLEWKKEAGASVSRDELLVDLETDKVVLEVLAPRDGVLKELLKGNGEQVAPDEVIARLDAEGEGFRGEEDKVPAGGIDGDLAATGSPEEKPNEGFALNISGELGPAVRKLVAEHELDPKLIPGTGRDGRITKGDVLSHLEGRTRSLTRDGAAQDIPVRDIPRQPASFVSSLSADGSLRPERRVPMSKIRARIAERLIEAQQSAAILTTFNEVNLQVVMALRERFRAAFEKKHGARLGFMSFFIKAAVWALRQFPIMNASLDGNDIVYHDYYDLGVAVGSPRGLVVPVIRNSDTLSFAKIEAKIVEFGEKANSAQLSIDDLSGGTFTITNGGIFGSLMSTPILNPPQSAILGLHKIQERPVAEDGEVVIRPMMYLALSYDHRIIDGQDAVRFLVAIKEAIEDPYRLLLDV
uniref:Dihydrolipoyllysine-residue succinyltransferase component of 2-oxoglutarate dehydrogenase complex n=1 Tax=Candidatus Kentrum sp. MB TaxID=2138164 RepID=A0A451BE62_9GAMM|nr:MAG: 2-oxoglutarate dehydrogenase E2 component [Candidatus Kentron sp. MB]VFK76570.1 MAG: 2-oxoglutarate dehydrogenase E2 component [Candidatus Kentron sp. MB]